MATRCEKMVRVMRDCGRAKGFFHVADLPTFLGQLPTFFNAEKLIIHLLSGTKFSSPGDTRFVP